MRTGGGGGGYVCSHCLQCHMIMNTGWLDNRQQFEAEQIHELLEPIGTGVAKQWRKWMV